MVNLALLVEAFDHAAGKLLFRLEVVEQQWAVSVPDRPPDEPVEGRVCPPLRSASSKKIADSAVQSFTFAWKDYADGNQSKTMMLDAVEFIRRFLLHVLPSGFVRIRHFGFLANRKREEKLALCRSLLPARQTAAEPTASCDSQVREQESHRCPICKIGGWPLAMYSRPG